MQHGSLKRLIILVTFCAPFCEARDDVGSISLDDGVFTLEQALRGEVVYRTACASCHALDMQGGQGARGLTGAIFEYQWANRSIAELYNALRSQMPPGEPGALGEQAYIDVLAAILQRNGFPAGATELEANEQVMSTIEIRWRRSQ